MFISLLLMGNFRQHTFQMEKTVHKFTEFLRIIIIGAKKCSICIEQISVKYLVNQTCYLYGIFTQITKTSKNQSALFTKFLSNYRRSEKYVISVTPVTDDKQSVSSEQKNITCLEFLPAGTFLSPDSQKQARINLLLTEFLSKIIRRKNVQFLSHSYSLIILLSKHTTCMELSPVDRFFVPNQRCYIFFE